MLKYFIFFIFSFSLFSQSASVKGVVRFQGRPEPLVNIYVNNPGLQDVSSEKNIPVFKGTVSDNLGNYHLDLAAGQYQLEISALGFKTISRSIIVQSNTVLFLDFDLVEDLSGLEEVVISGSLKPVLKLKSTVPVEVYTKSFFNKNPTPSVFDALQNINGVRPQINCNVCNTGDIHINGLEGPYTFVLIDGMPIVSGLSTVYGLTGIPNSLVDRVEIVKGPASTLYGSEAVGGIINLITKSPITAPRFSTDLRTSSWGEVNVDFGSRFNLGSKVQSLLGINYYNFQNPVDNNGDNFTDLTLQKRISLFNKISVKRKSQKQLDIATRYFYEDRWGGEMQYESRLRGSDEVYGESIFTSRWELFGTYQLPVKTALKLDFSANGHEQNSFYGVTPFKASQYIGFGQLTWNKAVAINHDILMGLAYRYTYYDDNTFATLSEDGLLNKSTVTHLPGIFVQDDWTINTQNKLLVGLRYDYNSVHGSVFSPRINYKWNSINSNNVVRLSFGNGFRVANVFTEDHAALTGARSVHFEGNLKPETSWNVNLNHVTNMSFSSGANFGIDSSVFYTYFSNRILPDYETDPNKIIYANLNGNAISKGISTNITATMPSGIQLAVGATLMDVSVTDNGVKSRQLLTERFSGVWNLSVPLPNLGLTIDYTANIYGPMRLPLIGENDPRPAFSPWYSIQNIQFRKSFANAWEWYAGIKNLLNFTPPKDSISRAFDPFDNGVDFDAEGNAIATPNNPNALVFDPSYVYASNQGIHAFVGLRYTLD